MSKVIRISQQIFSRLQQLAEPLVDTPASVIERLLDFYQEHKHKDEGKEKMKKETLKSSQSKSNEPTVTYNREERNLFLVPASEENIRETILKKVHLNEVQARLTPDQREYLSRILGDGDDFYCWAMTEGKRSEFEAMKKGDIVLMTVKNTGQFNFKGTVIGKIENEELGKLLWNFVPNDSWRLIYFIDKIEQISCDKETLVRAIGYKENFAVPGVIKVKPDFKNAILSEYGSIDSFIEAVCS
ncbi:hypothetical protein [Rhodocaloribacter sp.]